jgi:glycosyltransferase involved in cell wall biosynthesis
VVFFRGWDKNYENRVNQQPKLARKLANTFGRASAVIVLASEFKDQLEKWGFDENKIVVETTTVDDRLLNSLDILGHIKDSASKDAFNILFLARIEKGKGVYDAIDTYRILKSKYSFVTLTIAGDGSELPLVRDYISRNKVEGVKILGWVDRESKRKAYLDADLYLFPTSWGEGMPNSVLEAMAFGLPIITRPVGGLTDFFEDGKMGSIMQSKSPEKLASACEKFIEDRAFGSKVSEYNHNYAVNRFLASRVAKRIEEIYQSVLTSYASGVDESTTLLEKKAR